MRRTFTVATTVWLIVAGCRKEPASSSAPAGKDKDPAPAAVPPPPGAAPKATADEAKAWMDEFEKERKKLLVRRERADWVRSTYITKDTEEIQAEAEEALMALGATKAREVQRFADLELPPELARKVKLVRTSQTLPAPGDAAKQAELATLIAELSSIYGKGRWCPPGGDPKACLTLGDLSKQLAESRDPAILKEAWLGWRTISVPMRDKYKRFVELANEGAKEMGFADLGALWRSKYDMPPDEVAKDMDRLWDQARPLYELLHCYVRKRLYDRHGPGVVGRTGPIPAHLLGNMWAQDWGYLDWLVLPQKEQAEAPAGSPVTQALVAKGTDAVGMAKYAEAFFVSLGLPELPATFWERSMFTRPKDREVECHASAWPVDWYQDVRIKMCIEINEEDFTTLHHELGHIYYYDAYKDQPTLFADSANDGFHEAVGDTIALSVTPSYLKEIKLVEDAKQDDVEVLMRRALEKVAFLPFGLLIDKWRWLVFSGEVTPERYNQAWWELRQRYQGVAPPVPRTEAEFDPGAKYHVASSVPYMRYFIAHILQFQLHRALCRKIGHQGPLHQCSIYGNKQAGEALSAMMRVGLSKPWPDALEIATGQRTLDASALLDYFAPLMEHLKKETAGETCGW